MTGHVCILTNYRTGSTSFIRGFADQNKLVNKWEVFNATIPYAENVYKPEHVQFQRILPQITHSSRGVAFKVMGDQLGWDENYFDQLIVAGCTPIYLYRRDFAAQAKSWTSWLVSEDWNHHYGQDRTYKIDCGQDYFDAQTEVLVKNYEFMYDMANKYPGRMVCYEELFTNNPRPYNRKYDWTFEPVMNHTFDTGKFDEL